MQRVTGPAAAGIVDSMDFTLPPRAPPADLAAVLPTGLSPALVTATATMWGQAPFLKGLLRRRPAVLRVVAEHGGDAGPGVDAAFAAAMALAADNDRPVATRLRQARGDVALVVALADLAGLWPLERVTAALSDFADLSIDAAIGAALAERGAPWRSSPNRRRMVMSSASICGCAPQAKSPRSACRSRRPNIITRRKR